MKEVNQVELIQLIKNTSDKIIMIDFSGEWCNPCKRMPPILEEVKTHFKDKIIIVTVDVDKNRELTKELNITSIPCVMFALNGDLLTLLLPFEENGKTYQRQLDRMTGVRSAENYIKFIDLIFSKKK